MIKHFLRGLFLSLTITTMSFGPLLGQDCLQLLDSTEFFQDKQREKAIYYGVSLLQKLDSGECDLRISLIDIYDNLGLALWEAKDQPMAMYAFERSLASSPSDSLDASLLKTYYNMSALNQELGQFAEAESHLRSVSLIVAKEFDPLSIENLQNHFNKGVFYRETGRFKESMESLNIASQISNKIEISDSLRIDLLIEIGTTYKHFGDLGAAEESLTKAIKMAKELDELLYLMAIDRLSALKIEQGEYSESESYLMHNLEVISKTYPDDSLLVLETLNGLGNLYYKINDLESADKYLDKANVLSGNIGTIKPYMMNNLGVVYLKLGNTTEALEYFKQGAEGFKKLFGSMHPDYASCLNNMASTYKELGDLGEALNLYMKVLDMDKVIYGSSHQRYATTLNNIAMVYMQLGSNSLAVKLLIDSKNIRAKALGTHHPLYVKSLNDLGLYYLISGDTLQSIQVLDEALQSEIQHMRDVFPVLTRQQRQLYFKMAKSNVERFCSLAFSDSYIHTEWAEIALNHFINTKGILFYASDKMRNLVLSSDNEDIKKTYEEWGEKKHQLAKAYLLVEEERHSRGISLEKLEEESNVLEKKLALSFSVFSDHESSKNIHWQAISAALPKNTAALDIIHHRNYSVKIVNDKIVQGFEEKANYTAFIIKPDTTLTAVTWSHEQDLDRGFKLYTNLLKYNYKDTVSYHTYWRAIDQKLDANIKRVYMAPDGVYYKLNPAVFLDTKTNQYVSDKYDIINITSTKDLITKKSTEFVRNAKIFGNPAYDKLLTPAKISQLPGAELEAKEITGILDVRKWDTESFYFLDATEDKVKELDNPGVVHIATHGYFNDDPSFTEPLNSSGLFLSRTDDSPQDGVLSAYEAMNLSLDRTSVVVLAACETGLGTVKNGEGVFGLQRAFLVAGAKNVLISLVKINDQAARRFMNIYYEQLLESEDPQAAFFSARTKFKKEDPNPYNWGAYILVSRN
ncbi:MAG: tetratricopeptide repeat protein [Reichenbachiella sp.]